jgi:cysteinyl-tRNA synthetase
MPRYGQLSNRRLEDQEAGARVAVEAHKRNAGDFVLWKQSSADQPGWEASFQTASGEVSIFGRPGWHIECSAMSMAKLLEPFGGGLACDDPTKNTFDIHGGGIDLVFPHHENEIAQSCCAFGQPGQPNPLMASIWMHNGFLQVEGQKMSKSLGNFVTINELLATEKFGGQPWHGSVLRLAMLGTDYKQPIDWTLSLLESSRIELRSWIRAIQNLGGYDMAFEGHFLYEIHEHFKFEDVIAEALADDLNFPLALKELRKIAKFATEGSLADGIKLLSNLHALGFVSETNILSIQGLVTGEFEKLGGNVTIDDVRRYQILESNKCHEAAHALFEKMSDAGVIVSLRERGLVSVGQGDGSEKVDSLISLRLAARAAKNWAESDRIRDELSAMGIQLKDGKDEAGNPVTTWEVKR